MLEKIVNPLEMEFRIIQ